MFLQVEDGLFYKKQREKLSVGGTGRVGECGRHICSCRSLGGPGSMGTFISSDGCNRLCKSPFHLSI